MESEAVPTFPLFPLVSDLDRRRRNAFRAFISGNDLWLFGIIALDKIRSEIEVTSTKTFFRKFSCYQDKIL